MARITATVEQPALELPKRYTWSFPGSPVKIQIALEVVERLQEQFRQTTKDAPQGGCLLGVTTGSATEILDFHPLSDPQPTQAADLAERIPSSVNLEPVGYYRTTTDPVLRLTESDIALAKAVFPQPHQVFLLIQSSDSNPANATFFFWDEGQMCGDFPFLEFPFDAPMLADAEQHRIELAHKKVVQLEVPAPVPAPVAAPRRKLGLRLFLWSVIAALLIAVSFVAFFTPRGSAWLQNLRSLQSAQSPAPQTQPAPIQRLGLRAQRQNSDLEITWNRESEAIRTATSGSLTVIDNNGLREIALDASQIRGGSILYAPTGDQVQADLNVVGPQGNTTESVIVLLPRTGPLQVQPVAPKRTLAVPSAITTRTPGLTAQPVKPPLAPPENAAPSNTAANPVSVPPVEHKTVEPSTPAVVQPLATVTQPAATSHTSPPPAQPAAAVSAPAETAPKPVSEPKPVPATPAVTRTAPPSVAAVPYSPPQVERKSPVVIPEILKPMLVRATVVEVMVSIDASGKVTKAEVLPSATKIPVWLSASTLRAAKLYKFKPARRGSEAIPGEMLIQFDFKPPL